jgi:hypothetical protein
MAIVENEAGEIVDLHPSLATTRPPRRVAAHRADGTRVFGTFRLSMSLDDHPDPSQGVPILFVPDL